MTPFHREFAIGPAIRACFLLGLTLGFVLIVDPIPAPSLVTAPAVVEDRGLVPTAHEPLPATWAELWLVPEAGVQPGAAARAVAEAVRRLEAGDAAGAIAVVGRAPAEPGGLTGYAALVAGRAYQRLQRAGDARQRYEAALTVAGDGALKGLSAMALAEVAESSGDTAGALDWYVRAAAAGAAPPDIVQAGILRTALAVGDTARARAAAAALYYDMPASDNAAAAAGAITAWKASASDADASEFAARELKRADLLFEARRYADARTAYDAARARLTGEDALRALVRGAAADFLLNRNRAAADALAPVLDQPPYAAEARYYHLRAVRALGQQDRYVALVREMTDRYPASPWAAEALNHLASTFIVANEDERALEVFARILDQHPSHRHAERAAWKLGWARYRQGRYAEASATFERGAANAPRSDYRPSWLFWSGRARERTGDAAMAIARYRVAVADYQNSYYGRLAQDALTRLHAASAPPAPAGPAAAADGAPASRGVSSSQRALVRELLAAGLWDFAAGEVEFALRTSGRSAALEATLAWIHNRRGDLRRGIGAMRRAYPQFMAAGGEQLPAALQQVIFPLDYGGLIERYARQRDLDPFLVAALVAQESSFQADARSVANARGLMQIMPATGRRLAQTERIARFTTARLVDPELNVRLGTRYFAGLVGSLGEVHLALASYNAGKSRVDRWLADRPGLSSDEFIDDIPFPETQNYVKRILGTAEDYRRLYGETGLSIVTAGKPSPPVPPVVSVVRPSKGAAAARTPAAKKPAAKKPAAKPRSTTKATVKKKTPAAAPGASKPSGRGTTRPRRS